MNNRIVVLKVLFFIVLLITIVSCRGQGPSNAAGAVETYFKSLIAKDENQLVNISCAAWESNARQELRAFDAVTVTLDGLKCNETTREGNTAQIDCTGKIVANYGNEILELNLADRSYIAVNESGDWRMCGFR